MASWRLAALLLAGAAASAADRTRGVVVVVVVAGGAIAGDLRAGAVAMHVLAADAAASARVAPGSR